MEFSEITEDSKVYPGEYIYHEPSKAIVLVGSFNRKQNRINTTPHMKAPKKTRVPLYHLQEHHRFLKV